jgi:hypothetical protein
MPCLKTLWRELRAGLIQYGATHCLLVEVRDEC